MKYQLEKTSRLGNRVVNEDRIGVAETSDAILLVLADGMAQMNTMFCHHH